MSDTEYLHDDGSIDVQIDGVIERPVGSGYELAVDVSAGTMDTELYTYSDAEGYYIINPDDAPKLVEYLDALLRSQSIQRNPDDVYELSVSVTDNPSLSESDKRRYYATNITSTDSEVAMVDEVFEKLEQWEQQN